MIPVIYLPILIFAWLLNAVKNQIDLEIISVMVGAAVGGLVPFFVSWHLMNKKQDRESRRTSKEQFMHSIASRTCGLLYVVHRKAFPKAEIADYSLSLDDFQSLKIAKEETCRICQSFTRLKKKQGILIQNPDNFEQSNLYAAADAFDYVVQQLEALRQEFFGVIPYLRSELNELMLVFNFGQLMKQNMQDIDNLLQLCIQCRGKSIQDIRMRIIPETIDDKKIKARIYEHYQNIDMCLDNAMSLFNRFVMKCTK